MIYQFPQLAMKNRKLIEQSKNAGCFKCMQIFPSTDVKEYTDNDQTVLCPLCGVDSVVGDMCGFNLSEHVLRNANIFWYTKK